MTKLEIINTVAYAGAPEDGRTVTRTPPHSSIKTTTVVSPQSPLGQQGMLWSHTIEQLFLAETKDLRDFPCSELFGKLHEILVGVYHMTAEDLPSDLNIPAETIERHRELHKEFIPKIEKLRELAQHLEIEYQEPEDSP